MTMNMYEVGDRVRLRTSTPFQDGEGEAFDPQVVYFEVKEPGEETATYTYDEHDNVSRLAAGDYACDVDVNTAGVWKYHIIGEQDDGENRGADQGSFRVVTKRT